MNWRRIVLLLGSVAAATVFSSLMARTQNRPAAGRVRWDARRSLGTPKTFRNLTLIPIYDSAAKPTTAYLTLDEGLKAKVVAVKEKGGGGSVNTLYITNRGRKPLYGMAGEVVLGGQQDRCLGRDVIIPPGKRDVPVTVFCVEHGRWTGRQDFDNTAVATAAPDIRAEAQEGAFMAARAPAAVSGPRNSRVAQQRAGEAYAREAPVSAAQGKVWQKVSEKNRRFGAAPATDTYREVLNMQGGQARSSIAPYLKALSASLGGNPQTVGVVAAVNGKVTAADVFGDPALFRKLWPKLLRSYAADAAERRTARTFKTVTAEQARAFLAVATDAKSRIENRSDVSSSLRLESKDARAYMLVPKGKAAPGAALGGGGFGGAVHGSIIGK